MVIDVGGAVIATAAFRVTYGTIPLVTYFTLRRNSAIQAPRPHQRTSTPAMDLMQVWCLLAVSTNRITIRGLLGGRALTAPGAHSQ